ncbi:MAG: UDP-3-O-acyl-N-acetylglucosamine deacetylase [Cyanobacteria bacterium J06627_28]
MVGTSSAGAVAPAAQALSAQASSAQPSQKTLANPVSAVGVGLHIGQMTTVRLVPAAPDQGRYFVRTDLPEAVKIPATVDRVIKTQLSTELGIGADSPQTVRTVEHLLAALTALGLDNVRIEIDGPELPLLDGSAQKWIEAIVDGSGDETEKGHNTQAQSAGRKVRLPVSEPISVQSGDAWVTAYPSETLRFSYGIDFELAAIGNQWHSWSPDLAGEDFASAIAPARTFGLAHQIDYLRSQGLIKGGSLDNALVCSADGWINPPLRFENEPARHKLLDLIGDLSLLGHIPTAHYVAYKASHTLHVALAKKLEERCPFA